VAFEFVRPRVAGRWSHPQAAPQGQAVQPSPPAREGHGVKEDVDMAKTFLCNAFSLSMLNPLPPQGRTVKVRPVSLEEVKSLLREGYESAVGHPATAEVLTTLLGLPVEARRVSITLGPGDRILVFQLAVRLAEGQILSREEVLALYERGQASFCLVEVGQ